MDVGAVELPAADVVVALPAVAEAEGVAAAAQPAAAIAAAAADQTR